MPEIQASRPESLKEISLRLRNNLISCASGKFSPSSGEEKKCSPIVTYQ